MKLFGEHWVTAKFSERLEAFKHGQQREIETLKFSFSASIDRATKLHQREFETLPEAWATLVTAFNSVAAFTAAFQSYADISRMNKDDLEEFFADSDLSKSQQREIELSDDRNSAYQEVVFRIKYTKTADNLREHHLLLVKRAIFMSADLEKQFLEIGDLCWETLSEHRVKHELKEFGARPKKQEFDSTGRQLLDRLEIVVRDRLWSDVAEPAMPSNRYALT